MTTSFSDAQLSSLMANWEVNRDRSGGIADRSIRFHFQAIDAGFSGSPVYRVSAGNATAGNATADASNVWALKAFSTSVAVERMNHCGRLLGAASEHCDLLAPPLRTRDTEATWVETLGFRWELSRWIPGTPLAIDAPAESILLGGEAIGRVHRALAEALSQEERPAANAPYIAMPTVPRCVTDRIERLRHLGLFLDRMKSDRRSPASLAVALADQLSGENPGQPASDFRCLRLAESLVQARELIVRRWDELTPTFLDRLQEIQRHSDAMATSWVLRDVHRGHVLFVPGEVRGGEPGQRVTGLLDYDAIDRDSPAADIARWSGDFSGENQPIGLVSTDRAGSEADVLLDAAVAGYRQICPFPKRQRQLARLLIDVNCLGGLTNWLLWLTFENRQFAGRACAIRDRIIHLIASVCRIC